MRPINQNSVILGLISTLFLASVAQARQLSALTISPTSVLGGSSATGTIKLKKVATGTGLKIILASSSASANPGASVTVKAGSDSATFSIATSSVSTDTSATITATDPSGNKSTASLSVLAPKPIVLSSVSLSPTSITGGLGVTGSLKLSGKVKSNFIVTLASDKAFAQVPATVTISTGLDSATFKVTTSAVTQDGTATISAVGPSKEKVQTALTVKAPLTVKVTSLSLVPTSVSAGQSSTGTVTISDKAASTGFSITLSSDQKFAQVPGTVKVAAGQTSTTFAITTSTVTAKSNATITATDPSKHSVTAVLGVNQVSKTVVSMGPTTFNAQSITVAAGSVVEWSNDSGRHHTVTTDTGTAGLDSSSKFPAGLAQGDKFDWNVPSDAKSGTKYFYHCVFHGSAGDGKTLGFGMSGVIIVK